jgi:hypothetical protein
VRIGGRSGTRDKRSYVVRGRLSLRSPPASTAQKRRRAVRVRPVNRTCAMQRMIGIITREADGVGGRAASYLCGPSIT